MAVVDDGYGKKLHRRSGPSTNTFEVAKRRARACKGYILDEKQRMVGQAFNDSLPMFLHEGKLNIASGEDV